MRQYLALALSALISLSTLVAAVELGQRDLLVLRDILDGGNGRGQKDGGRMKGGISM